MSKLNKDHVIEKFTQAYQAANGKAPSIEEKGGWYSVDEGKNIRLADLDEMANDLSANAQKGAKEASPKASTKTSTAKNSRKKDANASTKKKQPSKSVAKKAASKKTKSKADAFSVKDFYTQQILEINAGSKAPR